MNKLKKKELHDQKVKNFIIFLTPSFNLSKCYNEYKNTQQIPGTKRQIDIKKTQHPKKTRTETHRFVLQKTKKITQTTKKHDLCNNQTNKCKQYKGR
jgi:hypothetical protein